MILHEYDLLTDCNFYAQADQICYSVLCVFSYVAAGQDQKKNPVVITPQIQDIHAQQRQQLAKQQKPDEAVEANTITSRSPKQHNQQQQQQSSHKQETITIRHTIPMQPPTITTTTVQPQAKLPTTTTPTMTITTTAQQQQQETHYTSPVRNNTHTRGRVENGSSGQLPQLPPRTPSLTSTDSPLTSPGGTVTKNRGPPPGPPPAIPPRTGTIARSGSVQVSSSTSSNPFAGARNFMRTISVNSTPPQFTPQPPPPFVIPKRRTSLSRASSVVSSTSTATSTPVSSGSQRPSYGSVHMGSSQTVASNNVPPVTQQKH